MNYPEPIQKLIDIFIRFPGIGPKQAARFAFFLLKRGENEIENLSNAVKNLKNEVRFCSQCFRSMEKKNTDLCGICSDKKRDQNIIMVVEKESDLFNMEKTGGFNGVYHLLGGVILPLDPDSSKNLHLKDLFEKVKSLLDPGDKNVEVVLATNPTTDGDTTALYIDRILEPLKNRYSNLKISRLGRGLSLGSELEYADEATIKHALTNRK